MQIVACCNNFIDYTVTIRNVLLIQMSIRTKDIITDQRSATTAISIGELA